MAEEIAMDHLEEIPDYYTRLKDMEKEAKKELSLESKRLMALAGIKEGDKKFLANESFQENTSKKILKESMGDITPEEWKEMLQMRNKAAATNENKKDNDDFIVFELDQKHFEPGQDDDTLYKLG